MSKTKKIVIVGLILILIIFIILLSKFYFTSNKEYQLYNKYSSKININYHNQNNSYNYDYDGNKYLISTKDYDNIYLANNTLYYQANSTYYKYNIDNYENINQIISDLTLNKETNKLGNTIEYSSSIDKDTINRLLKTLFINYETNNNAVAYLTINDKYLDNFTLNIDDITIDISFKKLKDDYKVSMLGFYEEQTKDTNNNILEIKEKENNKDTVKQIISAADAYVSANKEEIEKLYEGYNFVDITIKDLKNNGLLNDDIIDPNTNEKYSDDEKVRITLNGSTGTVEFTISPEEKDNTYLIADDIYLKNDANNTNWCDNDNNVFMGLNSSDKNASRLVLVNASSADETYTLVKNDTIVKKECNVNAIKAGNYEIKYEYTYNGSTVSKTRNVHVSSNAKDIESFTAIINENHNKLFLDASKEETNITLNITYRNGTKDPKETTIAKLADEGFKISEFDTSTIGAKKSIITYANTNSDGSIPSPFELTYIVSEK